MDAANIFSLIENEKVNLFCAAPTILITIANADEKLRKNAPKGLRVITAGAPPAAHTIERMEEEFGWELTQVYGLTETSPFITICESRPEHDQLNSYERSIIKARQGVELISSGELMVVNDDNIEVTHDGKTMGEIIIRGNVVMKGYYKDQEATDKAIRNGWFHTGDAAVVHPDGYVEIRDRIKDVIISGGENISSIEVECVLLRHPAIQEVGVVGMPHEKWGESPHAFVVLRSGQSATEAELKEFVGKHLASFKKPQWISFVKELPKTATGKIQKYVLRGGRSAISKQ
jgi:fatty-acyl-CoA synthase